MLSENENLFPFWMPPSEEGVTGQKTVKKVNRARVLDHWANTWFEDVLNHYLAKLNKASNLLVVCGWVWFVVSEKEKDNDLAFILIPYITDHIYKCNS